MYKKVCTVCKKDFTHRQPNTKRCSKECTLKFESDRWGRTSDKTIASGTVGALAELVSAADLMNRGYAVFRALSPACFCDLVAFKKEKFLRIEVRTGYEGVGGYVSFPTPTRDKGRQDIYAVYIRAENKVLYFSPDKHVVDI